MDIKVGDKHADKLVDLQCAIMEAFANDDLEGLVSAHNQLHCWIRQTVISSGISASQNSKAYTVESGNIKSKINWVYH